MQPLAYIVRGPGQVQPAFTDLLVQLAREAGLIVLPAVAEPMEPARS